MKITGSLARSFVKHGFLSLGQQHAKHAASLQTMKLLRRFVAVISYYCKRKPRQIFFWTRLSVLQDENEDTTRIIDEKAVSVLQLCQIEKYF